MSTSQSIIYLDNLDSYKYFKANIEDLNTINITENEYIYMFSVFLRILLLCDQLHDFNENEDRNKLFKNDKTIKNQIYQNFKEVFNMDLNYLKDNIVIDNNILKNIIIKPPINKSITFNSYVESTVNDLNNTINIKYDKAISIINICGIKSINLKQKELEDNKESGEILKWKCTDNFKYLPNALENLYGQHNDILDIFIDADKSKYNTSMISNMICDLANNVKDEMESVNFIDTDASDFDSSTKSGLQSLGEHFTKSENVIFKKSDQKGIISIKLSKKSNLNLEILNFQYKLMKTNLLDKLYNLDNEEAELYIIKRLSIKAIKTLYDKVNSKKKINFNKNYIKTETKIQVITILLQEIVDNKYKDIYEDESYNEDEISMNIKRFYSIECNIEKKSSECSVNKITKYINENTLLYNPVDFVKNTLFKTLGDFGQIIMTHIISESSNNLTYFITFDNLCSYISSLFNRGTLRENTTYVEFPIDIFIPISRIRELSIKRPLKTKLNRHIRKLSLSFRKQFNKYMTKFGKHENNNNLIIKMEAKKIGLKYSNVSIIKLKKQINYIKKLSKLYSIKLDKNVIKNIKLLLKVQNIAKKNNIRITKTVKGKRVYKTLKELKKQL